MNKESAQKALEGKKDKIVTLTGRGSAFDVFASSRATPAPATGIIVGEVTTIDEDSVVLYIEKQDRHKRLYFSEIHTIF